MQKVLRCLMWMNKCLLLMLFSKLKKKKSFWWISAHPFLFNVEKFRSHRLAIVFSIWFVFFEHIGFKLLQSQDNSQWYWSLILFTRVKSKWKFFGGLLESIAQLSILNHLNVVRTYVIHLLGIYVTILCNWLIFWQNALYLYLDRSRMCLILQETRFQV